jgi:phage replication O-like protein O
MDKQLIPNSTQIPNLLLDFVLPELPSGEMRCLLYICRRTFGFHKEQDRISFSQFVKGIKDKDKGCGVTRPVVSESIKNLLEARAIFVQRDTRGNVYKINLDLNPAEVVKKVNQLRKLTKSGKESKPKVVKLLNLQKKGNIGNKEKICLTLKDWNERQSSPIVNFKPENIVNKYGIEKIDQMIKYYGQRNGGFSEFLRSLKN